MLTRTSRFLLLSLVLCCPVAPAWALNSLSVIADNSMSLVIAEIARHYSVDHDIVVNTSFAHPKYQQAKITEGVAADVLITPEQEWIEKLKTQGLIDVYSPTVIARNRLVLVGPVDSKIDLASDATRLPTADIIRALGNEPGFVVPHPETLIEGVYAREALQKLDIADYLEPYTLYVKQLGPMYEMIRKAGGYGIFLSSSTVKRPGVKVIGRIPDLAYPPINYSAVVLAGENMDEARKFLQYLSTAKVRDILQDNGFTIE